MIAPRTAMRVHDWLQPRRASGPRFGVWDALAVGALFVYFLFYPHPGFDGLVPDNIAQTAYWSLLTRPDLVGGIGSSSPKGGLILLLGSVHSLSYEVLESEWLFKATLALFFTGSLYMIGRIAAELGGLLAGLLAVLVAAGSTYLTVTFYTGSSNLFFLPPVLLGLWLLSTRRERAAILMLCLASTIRPEALLIVALIIALRVMPRGEWRRAIGFAGLGALALAVFVLPAYWTQGSWERVGGGAATGYPAFASLRTVEHARATLGQLFSERFVPLLLLPALFVAVRVERARVYLYFYSMVLAFMLLVLIGFFGMHYRYVAAGQAVLFALGCAGLARMYADSLGSSPSMLAVKGLAPFSIIVVLVLAMTFWATRSLMTCLLTLAIPTLYLLGATARRVSGSGRLLGGCHIAAALFVAIASVASAAKARHEFDASLDTRHPAISDALEFLDDPRVPPGSAVIAEDELLNYVLAKRPDYLTHARSIQSFNVMTDSQRREALSRAGILYVSKRRNYGWNYLFYFPRAQWVTDPFRVAVLDMIRTNQPRSILGFVAEPIYNSSSRLVARIKPDLAGAPETTEPASQ